MDTKPKTLPPVVMTKFGILIEWYCMAVTLSDSEAMAFVRQGDGSQAPDLMRADRLYGGFGCDRTGRRHVMHDAGAYKYIDPRGNRPVTPEERAERWAKVISECAKGPDPRSHYKGGGPFTSDAPVNT